MSGDWNDDAIARLRCGFFNGIASRILSNQSKSSVGRLAVISLIRSRQLSETFDFGIVVLMQKEEEERCCECKRK